MSDPTDKLATSDRLQYMEVLRSAAYDSFNDRRSYEWKLSLAIWTALAVLVAGLVQPLVFPLQGHRYGIVASIVGFLIVLLHIFFNNGMARANAIDKIKGRIYENQIESALKLEDTETYLTEKGELERVKQLRPSAPKYRWTQWWQWGHLAQIGITALLAATAVAILWVRAVR